MSGDEGRPGSRIVPDLLRASAAHVFVADLDAPALSADDEHHLRRVLRLRDGEAMTISDGAGRWRACVLAGELRPTTEIATLHASPPPVTVGFALVKAGGADLVVQKLTELGVDRIVPFVAERSVARWEGDRALRHAERLRAVARAAAMQSRRCWLPRLDDPGGPEVLIGLGAAAADPGGAAPSLARPAIAVGPEGGWAPEELDRFGDRVALGTQVLRAETAAIVAGALLTGLRAGLVAPSV